MKILIIGAYPKSVVEFRGQLIKTLVDQGHKVTVMTALPEQEVVNNITALGAHFIPYTVQRNGLNPMVDFRTLLQLKKVMTQWQPDKTLAYTIKPIIWGGIANRLSRQGDFYAMITGLGYAFEKGTFLRNSVNALVKLLYKIALTKAKAVIFQNNENMELFGQLKLVKPNISHRVYGSGVDISQYGKKDLPQGQPTFLLIARLLGDKGIREFASAARAVKKTYPEVKFQLLGPVDSSPDKITIDEVNKWVVSGEIEYLGETNNVIPFIEKCHIYTLPSYHEGLPRTVLEAMAIGRPILTTEAIGCRDTVIDNKNGRKVPVKSSELLAEQIIWFIEHPEQWSEMAKASRNFACELFDVKKVNENIIQILSA